MRVTGKKNLISVEQTSIFSVIPTWSRAFGFRQSRPNFTHGAWTPLYFYE